MPSRQFNKPDKFNHNLVVIGAGSGGLVSAYIAAAVKAKVVLIEKHKMGGDCLNTGCVPSKALLRSATLLHQINNSQKYGIRSASAEVDFSEVMARVKQVVKDIEPHDSVARYRSLGVEVIEGEAQITSPWTVEVNGQRLTTRNIIIATGAHPFVPQLPGLAQIDYLTSDNLWELPELPERLLVVGGGPIGCELGQAFRRLGSEVTIVQRDTHLLPREDSEFSQLVSESLIADGIGVNTSHSANEIVIEAGEKQLICDYQGQEVRLPFDQIIFALGRNANISGFGLEGLEIPTRPNGTIETNPFLQTSYPNIFAVGDVAGPYQFTHTAAHQAWYATVNALFGRFKKFKVDYSVIPWATFTDPEVARVGLNEREAIEQGVPYEETTYGIDDLDRAIVDSSASGMVKVLTVPGKDRILGVTIAGEHAAELIGEFVLAMRHGLGLNKILGTIHIYPTLSEANKYAAGNWKKAHTPQRLLKWIERYHRWMRR